MGVSTAWWVLQSLPNRSGLFWLEEAARVQLLMQDSPRVGVQPPAPPPQAVSGKFSLLYVPAKWF